MKFLFLTLALSLSMGAFAQSNNVLDDFDPTAEGAEAYLEELGMINESETGLDSWKYTEEFFGVAPRCRQRTCDLFIEIDRATQRATLFENGTQTYVWKVSTGVPGRSTPAFEGNPDGRIFIKKDSTRYPSKNGGYKGMGNMPYAVMYNGPYGIHGTAAIAKLGQKDSHGCTRLHPDNAKIFNTKVRKAGFKNTWISIR